MSITLELPAAMTADVAQRAAAKVVMRWCR